MGLLDGLLNSMMSGTAGSGGMTSQQSPLLQMALQILQQNGGIEGVLAKFQQAGYGAQAGSWVSTGQNVPISGDVLSAGARAAASWARSRSSSACRTAKPPADSPRCCRR